MQLGDEGKRREVMLAAKRCNAFLVYVYWKVQVQHLHIERLQYTTNGFKLLAPTESPQSPATPPRRPPLAL